MSARPGLRVYFVRHVRGSLTGYLMRKRDCFWDGPVPAAYGSSEQEILEQLEVLCHGLLGQSAAGLEPYLWEEERFQTQRVNVTVMPQAVVDKRFVIGKTPIPLKVSYAYCGLDKGGYRVMLPRHGWWMILEDLATAPRLLQQVISASLLGEDARWVFEFRGEGPEWVREWEPEFARKAALDDQGAPRDELETVSQVAEELVAVASGPRRPLAVGEAAELTQVLELARRDPPGNLLLVGEPGVGKTTLVQRLARAIVKGGLGDPGAAPPPEAERRPRIWSTGGDRMVAGMAYLGEWEQRCLAVVSELAWEGDYLHFDRLSGLVAERSGGTSIADMLRDAVASGELSLIAEATPRELEQARRLAPQLVQRFHQVQVLAPPDDAMPALLKHYLAKRRAGIELEGPALRRLVAHLGAFERERAFPGKGFAFIDWLLQDAQGSRRRRLQPTDITAAFSRRTGLPAELISDDTPAASPVIAARLSARVIGQPDACAEAAHTLARFKAGLDDPERPIGSLLFVGPTGVGKTELAKQIARYMFGDAGRMVRVDMSELMLPGAARRLLASGRGVKSLATQVREQPLSVVLFDEVEKAHAEVFDLLLGVLGEGRLTDDSGRLVDFRMTLIVMTSNLGVREGSTPGFVGDGDGRATFMGAVRRHFRPELFNRIDAVVPFRALTPEDIESIVDILLAEAAARTGLSRRAITLRVHKGATAVLAKRGWHPTRGARPLARAIEELVVTPLAVRLAAEPELHGVTYHVLAAGERRPRGAREVLVLPG